jgi:hypothetical protein
VTVSPDLERKLVQDLLRQTRDMGFFELWQHPNAVEVLGLLPRREQVRVGLVAIARDDETLESVRDRTADALARLGSSEDLRALSADRDVAMGVRVRAAEHLGRYEPPAAKSMLEATALSAGVDGYVRMDAARSLWRLGFERSAQSAVLFLALDPEFVENEYWRVGSAELLGELGRREEAIELLFRAFHEPRLIVSAGMATSDLVSALVALGEGRALLDARADAAEPERTAERLVRSLYRNGEDELGATVLAEILARTPTDELILTEADFTENTVLSIVETAHRHGVKVRLAPRTTELLVQQGEYVPGQGVPLFELKETPIWML